MNRIRLVRTALVIGIAAAALLLATCTNPVLGALTSMNSKTFGIAGSWKNASGYATSAPPQCYQITINSDGTFRSNDATMYAITGTYTVDSVSTAGDVKTLTVHFQWNAIYHCYALVRVTAPSTYETNGYGMLPYPTAIVPSDTMTYSKFVPQ